MTVRQIGCRDCERVTSGDCGKHGPQVWPAGSAPPTVVHLDAGKDAVCQCEDDDLRFTENLEQATCLACLRVAAAASQERSSPAVAPPPETRPCTRCGSTGYIETCTKVCPACAGKGYLTASRQLQNLVDGLGLCDACQQSAVADVDSPVVLCGACFEKLRAVRDRLKAEWMPEIDRIISTFDYDIQTAQDLNKLMDTIKEAVA